MFLFFRNRNTNDQEIQAREESVLEQIRNRYSEPVIELPHLYDLTEKGETVKTLLDENLSHWTVFSWLAPRAAYWILKKWGIPGEITCFDLSEMDQANPFRTEIKEVQETKVVAKTALHSVSHQNPSVPTVRRWYPVIDQDACISCLECVNYCMFGVYEIGPENRPLVEQPDACRDGCPACARVCPGNAIMFPEYNDPIISGRVIQKTSSDTTEPELPKSSSDELDDLIDSVEN